MAEDTSINARCLSRDEAHELQEAWQAVMVMQTPVAQIVGQGDTIDCDALHEAFLELCDTYDAFERLVMRAKQIRLLQVTQGNHEDS